MNMVIICSSEKLDNCRLGFALIHRKFEFDLKDIQFETIKEKLLEKCVNASNQIPSFFDPSKSNIRVVTSKRAGNGKSLWISRKIKETTENLKKLKTFCFRFHDNWTKKVDLVKFFYNCQRKTGKDCPILFHLDLTNVNQFGLDDTLFSLLFLDCIMDKHGKVWTRNPKHYFLIECSKLGLEKLKSLKFFPIVQCLSPLESLKKYSETDTGNLKKEILFIL